MTQLYCVYWLIIWRRTQLVTKATIKIKASHAGRFTAYAKANHMTVQAAARKVLGDPNASASRKKQANFAKNAAGWNH
jgi:hypothetical protein